LTTVPAISRRSWRVVISRDYVERTLVREWAVADGFESEADAEIAWDSEADRRSIWGGRQMRL